MLRILRAQNLWSPVGYLPLKDPWRTPNPEGPCPTSSFTTTRVVTCVVAILRHSLKAEKVSQVRT